jgi:phosphoglycolate phosphatase
VLDAVLFDLDGTLTDPAIGITGSFRHALAAVGHPADDDVDLRWMIGPALADSLARYGLPEEHHATVIEAYRSRLREVGLFQATLIDGITAVLDGLRTDGVPLALASAKMVDMGETTLEHLGLRDRFTAVAGTLADGLPRTKGQIVGDALAALGSPDPSRVAMVGDRLHDIEGAREQGCIAIAVSWGFAEPGELAAHAPDHVVEAPADLLPLLRSLG